MPRALLIIDVQRTLCEGRHACFEVERVIDRINQVSRAARAAGVPVVLIQHETTGGGSMDRGSPGWELAPGLETAPATTASASAPPTPSTRPSCRRCCSGWGSTRW
jgi:nicotinamidase-related amidase